MSPSAHVGWSVIPRYGTDPWPQDAIRRIERSIIEGVELTSAERAEVRDAIRASMRSLAATYTLDVVFE